ncbi:tyrosine-protein kinase [Cesiribacter sp. SM1]|uniref:GumC family protein n=1 Tax=Cesiribacter sp. SM1 TaxID=2861196 RepID=UPI001CD6F4AE|nr:tyrosine-protein kinase [Cesiribacter sp. SM1]
MTDQENLLAEDSEQINFKEIILKYLRYWYLFLLATIVFFGLAYLYLRYTTPQYLVTTSILVKSDQQSGGLTESAVFNDIPGFKSSTNIDNEIRLLKSQSLMYRVFNELDLHVTYYGEGRIKDPELYGNSLPFRVITNKLDTLSHNKVITVHLRGNNVYNIEYNEKVSTHKFGQSVNLGFGEFTIVSAPARNREGMRVRVHFHDTEKVASNYSNRLVVEKDQLAWSSALMLSLVDPVPEKGVDILNKLIEVYNKEAVEDKNVIAANTIEFINERLKFLTDELTDVEKDVEEYKRERRLVNVGTEAEMYLQGRTGYDQQLAEYDLQLEILSSIENYLSKGDNDFGLVPSSLSIGDPTLQRLIDRFNELQLERQRLLLTNKPNNPLVQNLAEQLNDLRLNILENLRNIQQSMELTRSNLQANFAQFESKIEQVPLMEREIQAISRQQGIKEGLYLYLLQKREESALSLAATVSNSRVIDPATAGSIPVSPESSTFYMYALILGLGVPFAFIFVKEMLNNKVQEHKDVDKATATPVLGEIAHKRSGESLVVTKDSRSPVAELFRLIRANLQFANAGKENKVMLVTSSASGEGKTFFSLNLGASLALSGKRVVVVDFDLRKPSLLQNLAMTNDFGITNYLVTENTPINDLIKPTKVSPNLFLVGAGPIPPNPSELMLLPKIGELIEGLRQRFDYVIIDTSPVGQVADAFSLSAYIDVSLYLIRYQFTEKEQVKIVDDIYKKKKLKHTMIVLNDARKGGGYGYGKGYGYGYGQEKKKGFFGRLFGK